MQLDLKAITYEECKEAHKNINAVFETQICALTKEGEGACHVSLLLRLLATNSRVRLGFVTVVTVFSQILVPNLVRKSVES